MAQKSNKIIISCAITGSIHTPTMSDALPITPDQIATQAIDAAEAGAAILHLHARDPKDGRPIAGSERVHAVPAAHQAGCDAVVNITTGGAVTMTVEERIAAAHDALARDVLAQHGLDEFRALSRWRRATRPGNTTGRSATSRNSDGYIFPNTFRDIEKIPSCSAKATASSSSTSATTPATCTTSPIASIAAVQAAGVRAADLRHSRRHRRRPRQSAVHEAHGRSAVRRAIICGRCSPAAATR